MRGSTAPAVFVALLFYTTLRLKEDKLFLRGYFVSCEDDEDEGLASA